MGTSRSSPRSTIGCPLRIRVPDGDLADALEERGLEQADVWASIGVTWSL